MAETLVYDFPRLAHWDVLSHVMLSFTGFVDPSSFSYFSSSGLDYISDSGTKGFIQTFFLIVGIL